MRRYFNIFMTFFISVSIFNLFSQVVADESEDVELIGIVENRFIVVDEARVDVITSGQLRNVSGIYTFSGENGLITESYLDSDSRIHIGYYYLTEPVHDMTAGYGTQPLPVNTKLVIKDVSLYGYACLASIHEFNIDENLITDLGRIEKEVIEPNIKEIWNKILQVNLSEISIKRYTSLMENYILPNDGYNQFEYYSLFAYIPDENLIVFEGEGSRLPPTDDPRVIRKLMLYPVYNYKEGRLIKIIYTIKGEFLE